MATTAYTSLKTLTEAVRVSPSTLTALIDASGLLICPQVMNQQQTPVRLPPNETGMLLTVDCVFTCLADDESGITLRASGQTIARGDYPTNQDWLTARHHALLSALGVAGDGPRLDGPPGGGPRLDGPQGGGPRLDGPPAPDRKAVANAALTTSGHTPLVTADTLPAPAAQYQAAPAPEPAKPTKRQTAEQMKQLQDWQTQIDALDVEDVAAWNAHKQTLAGMLWLPGPERRRLFEHLRGMADQIGIYYDHHNLIFYK